MEFIVHAKENYERQREWEGYKLILIPNGSSLHSNEQSYFFSQKKKKGDG